MKTFINAALDRSRTVILLLIFFLISGLLTYISIPKESVPDVQVPVIYVSMTHKGISPKDAERLLVRPMEQKLRSIEGIKDLSSTAYEGGANVFMEFRAGFDSDRALEDVRAKVDDARGDLPQDTEDPQVNEVNLSLFPVLVVNLSGEVPWRTLYRHADELKDLIEEEVSSVLEVNIVGNREELVEIIVDPLRLEGYGLSLEDVIRFVKSNNKLIPAGEIDTGTGLFSIKVPGLIESATELLNIPLKTHNDAIIRFKDVAQVRRTYQDPTGFARDRGKPAVSLEVVKRTGENIIDTVAAVREVIEKEREDWPKHLNVSFAQDESNQILDMIKDLQNNLILAILLVMVIIVNSLGWRSALLVGLAVPGAFLMGIYVIGLMGVTLNIIVLFSLILSVGMLVDGAIIVVEFADRKMVDGVPKFEAYQRAAMRMTWPVVTSILTTIVVFLPLLFWPGMVGQFMKFLPLTLIATLTASILMALIFIPTLGSLFGKPAVVTEADKASIHATEKGKLKDLKGWTRTYVDILEVALRHPGKVMVGTIGLLVVIFEVYSWIGKGVEFFPNIEPNSAAIEIRARGNMSVYEKDALVKQVENRLLDMEEFETFYTSSDFGAKSKFKGGERAQDTVGVITVEFVDWKERRSATEILEEVLKRVSDIPGIVIEVRQNKPGPPVRKPVQIEIASQDYTLLDKTLEHIKGHLSTLVDLRGVEDTRSIPGIDWVIKVDRAQASKFGADVTRIGNTIKLLTNGYKIDEFRPDDSQEEVDIVIRYPESYRTLRQLKRMRVITEYGSVPIGSFVKFHPAPKITQIKRSNGKRAYRIKADVRPGVLADDQVKNIAKWLKQQDIDSKVSWKFKGEEEDKQETSDFLAQAFGTAIFMIAVILVTQFNNVFSMFLVLSSVVMSFVGVLIGLLVTGQTFSIVMGGIGIIALAGIIVSNNIILIDTFDHLSKSMKNKKEAILRTGAQRLRPVILTQLTTVLGLLPITFGLTIDFMGLEITQGAPSTQWWIQLSTAIASGLIFASPLTLIFTPCALMYRENWRKRKKKAIKTRFNALLRRFC